MSAPTSPDGAVLLCVLRKTASQKTYVRHHSMKSQVPDITAEDLTINMISCYYFIMVSFPTICLQAFPRF